MAKVLWGILAVILGLVTLFVVVFAGEFVGHTIFPPPPGLNPNDLESIKANIDKIPAGSFVSVLVGWAVAAFAGGWVAARIAPGESSCLAWRSARWAYSRPRPICSCSHTRSGSGSWESPSFSRRPTSGPSWPCHVRARRPRVDEAG